FQCPSMPIECSGRCGQAARIKRAKDSRPVCENCFVAAFEQDVHETIMSTNLFTRGEKVALGASGGKDSTVLAYVMKTLNSRFDYGLELFLLSIDEGIKGYRDDSLQAVERNKIEYDLPLKILSYKELYNWTMDEIVAKIGKKNNCTFCGVFRRQALDRGAHILGASKLLTGHNADDMAETVLMNVLRGDIARLERCTAICTSSGGEAQLPRAKPLKFCFEKDIVMYARVKNLDYFYTECIYAPNAYRQFARTFVKRLERTRPRAILDLIRSAENISVKKDVAVPTLGFCTKCNFISSQPLCKACLLLEGLNTGDTTIGVKKKTNKMPEASVGESCSTNGGCACDQDKQTVDF
uniref:Cytoplasmic tRNA 2-thiolation protein 1 n=1 Tax=Pristionchus pacificus TaxID=54126 RepID=A0A2A6BEL7_PRIPA